MLDTDKPAEFAELSERELEILRLVATGASNKEIAHKLTISTNTVKVHLRNIFAKVGAASRTEAALFAVRTGLVPEFEVAELLGAENGSTTLADEQLEAPSPLQASLAKYLLPASAALVLLLVVVYLLSRSTPSATPPSSAQIPAPPTITPAPNWRPLAEMPTPRSGFAVVAYENYIYAAAGKTSEQITGVMERYSPEENEWAQLSPKPLPVHEVAGALIGGLMYVPGGRTASGRMTDVLEVYDPRQDQWIRRAQLPTPLSAYSMVAFEGRLYLFGGWDGEKYLDTVLQYDPNQDEWNALSPMPTARAYSGATVAGGKVYVLGGYDGAEALTNNEVYLPDREGESPWERGEAMPEGRYAMGVVSVGDIIQVIGGQNEAGSQPVPLAYFPQLDQWQYTQEAVFPHAASLGLVPLGVNLFSLGGQVDQVPSGQNQAYQFMYTISIPVIVK
jgi:DNA-binding CsgD family transcriptional regulator